MMSEQNDSACGIYLGGDDKMSKELELPLNNLLADLNVFYTKLNNYHWYIEGEKFFELHVKFQEYYEEVAELIDEVAERNLMIGNRPIATLEDFLSHATLKEEKETGLNHVQMVERVLADYETMSDGLKAGIRLAGDKGEFVTEDFLIGILTSFEKHAWMLRAFLKK